MGFEPNLDVLRRAIALTKQVVIQAAIPYWHRLISCTKTQNPYFAALRAAK
ncbi:MAG: hypothetical protein AAFX78_14980 [Cyanobacteria bacterium J06638_20]